jgi:hypothetical protein
MRHGCKLYQVLYCIDQILWCRNYAKPQSKELQVIGELDWIAELHTVLERP